MNPADEFLKILAERDALNKRMRELAWEIVPNNIKELLYRDKGLFADGDYDRGEENAREWLISPKWQFGYKCPIEIIIDDKADEVKKLIIKLIYGIF